MDNTLYERCPVCGGNGELDGVPCPAGCKSFFVLPSGVTVGQVDQMIYGKREKWPDDVLRIITGQPTNAK